MSDEKDMQLENERLRRRVAELERENARVLARQERNEAELRESERAIRAFSEKYVEVEQKNRNLASLYVASFQLHGSVDRREVLRAIKEIVANLVGSEEMAVYETSDDGKTLSLAASIGIDEAEWRQVRVGDGPIGMAASSGRPFFATGEPITAAVPLVIGDRVHGVIVVFRLLEQKPALEPVDHELLDMLAKHASAALYLAKLHALATGKDAVV